MFYAFKPDWNTDGPLDKYDREISATWQRRLYHIEQKSTQPQLCLEKIEKFNATYPNWPFALVRLGRAYLLLEDLQGALEQFETALRLLSPVQDDKFARYVEGLRAYIKNIETEEDNEWNNPSGGVIVSPWAPPKDIRQFTFPDTSGASTVKLAWENMLSEDNTGTSSSRYARLVCVETNEFEKVFALGGESLPRLVKLGFYTGAIDCVMAGGVQERQIIVSILGDLQNSLDFLMNLAKNPSQLSEGSICRIHEITMKSCRIALYNDGVDEVFYLTHPGLYRKRLVSTTDMDGGIVQYTHHSKVHSEMKQFVDMMKNCLEKKDTCPFAVAAWIHSAFSRIHPFIDGNGRVSRLLASIPLIRAGYPFINIRLHMRVEYLQALNTASNKADLQPLVNVLASSIVDSTHYIRSLPPTSPEDEQYRYSHNIGNTQLYR